MVLAVAVAGILTLAVLGSYIINQPSIRSSDRRKQRSRGLGGFPGKGGEPDPVGLADVIMPGLTDLMLMAITVTANHHYQDAVH